MFRSAVTSCVSVVLVMPKSSFSHLSRLREFMYLTYTITFVTFHSFFTVHFQLQLDKAGSTQGQARSQVLRLGGDTF